MDLVVYVSCHRCARLPRPNCENCNGMGGSYYIVDHITPEQENQNQAHIPQLQSHFNKATSILIWAPKLKSYFIDSISFLGQYTHLHNVPSLIININRFLKYQQLSEIKSILTELKSIPAIEFVLRSGTDWMVCGSSISYLDQSRLLRISLFYDQRTIVRPMSRIINIKESLKQSSEYTLTTKRKLNFINSPENLEEFNAGQLATVKFSHNFSVEYFYLPKFKFDEILKSS